MSARYKSLLDTKLLDLKLNNVENFELSKLGVVSINNGNVENLRLGKQIERWVSLAINKSSKYDIVLENIQVFKGKITIGEFDFIIREIESNRLIHLELVYKFYLYRPSEASVEIHKWIGPNLKDSLIKKVDKLKNKQFPLLFKEESKIVLDNIDINAVNQQLCFMVNLFVPFGFKTEMYPDINNDAIAGYWYKFTDFLSLFECNFLFYIPVKSEWGLSPEQNNNWMSFKDILIEINECHLRQFSPMCWIKDCEGNFSQCFVVWW